MTTFHAGVHWSNDFRKWFSSKRNKVHAIFTLLLVKVKRDELRSTCWRGGSETYEDKPWVLCKDLLQEPFLVGEGEWIVGCLFP